MTKFIAAWDMHFGYERRGGHKVALHDIKAINALLKFAADFKPDTFILGGDIMDCGAISHHNHGKPGATEGLRLLGDMQECAAQVIKPIEALKPKQMVFIKGNHCAWLDQLIEQQPTLEGIIDLEKLLGLQKWKLIEQGGQFDLGKLTFLHGDTISGGEHVAKAAVINYERSVRFGHYHTHAIYTKNSPIDYKNAKTGMAVGCLCKKAPGYGKGKPNRWQQGFLVGFVQPGGTFNDYHVNIIDGQFTAPNGKVYKG